MISRPVYIEQLKNFINKPQIKIITGIRRSGKSTVLRLLREVLLNTGVKEEYVQVAYKLESEQTVEREYAPLLAVEDNYPKYVVTMDDFWKDSVNGVIHLYISNFLLSDNL